MTEQKVWQKVMVLVFISLLICGCHMQTGSKAVIKVKNPVQLGVDSIEAESIALGIPGNYKPNIAKLANGELLLIIMGPQEKPMHEDVVLYRSKNERRSWSQPEVLPLVGRESYLTVLKDGTIFITAQMHLREKLNPLRYNYWILHRSDDGGKTWASNPIVTEDLPGAQPRAMIGGCRNILELNDGSLIFGVGAGGGANYMWRSKDRGLTWDKTQLCEFEGVEKDKLWWGLFQETFLWKGMDGKITGIFRVDEKVFPPLPGAKRPGHEYGDQSERMITYESADNGKTWVNRKGLGTYGEMYPGVLKLQDGRLLLTFTVRSINPQLGVRAVLGYEDRDGFHFDFENDRIVISAKTPTGAKSGGGFGNTIQLDNGTLVTPYSYRGQDGKTHTEVLRWKLPSKK